MKEKVFQSFLNKILPGYPDDLILSIYQEIFEGLDKEQRDYFGQVLLNHPSILKSFAYSYTPVNDIELRLELLKVMFPRLGQGPKGWKTEKTFIIKQWSNEFEHGADIFNEEFGKLKFEILDVSSSIPLKNNPIVKKLNDLSERFTKVLKGDLIKLNVEPDPFQNFPKLTISEDGKLFFFDYPDSMTSEEVDKEIEKENWGLSEFLTEIYQYFQHNDHLKNLIFADPDYMKQRLSLEELNKRYPYKIIIRYKGEEKKNIPLSLFLKEAPLFSNRLREMITLVSKKERYKEPYKIRQTIIQTKIQEAIHKAAIKFPPGKFENIQGYYEKAAEFEGKELYSKYAEKFSEEMMDIIDLDNFRAVWNDYLDEIKHELGYEELEKYINKVINEKYFDPKLPNLLQGTPLEKYVEHLEIVSLDSSRDDFREYPIPDESLSPLDELLESERRYFNNLRLDNALRKAKTFKEQRIVKEIKKILSKEEEINIAKLP